MTTPNKPHKPPPLGKVLTFDELYKPFEDDESKRKSLILLTGNGFNLNFRFPTGYRSIFERIREKNRNKPESSPNDNYIVETFEERKCDFEKILGILAERESKKNDKKDLAAQKKLTAESDVFAGFIGALIDQVTPPQLKKAESKKEKLQREEKQRKWEAQEEEARIFLKKFEGGQFFTLNYDPLIQILRLSLPEDEPAPHDEPHEEKDPDTSKTGAKKTIKKKGRDASKIGVEKTIEEKLREEFKRVSFPRDVKFDEYSDPPLQGQLVDETVDIIANRKKKTDPAPLPGLESGLTGEFYPREIQKVVFYDGFGPVKSKDKSGNEREELVWQDPRDFFPPLYEQEPRKQELFHIHGALHIYQDGEDAKIKKIKKNGNKFMETIRSKSEEALDSCILKSSSKEKEQAIYASNYTSFCFEELKKRAQGTIFLYGFSLAKNDKHIWRAIDNNPKIEKVYISFFENEKATTKEKAKAKNSFKRLVRKFFRNKRKSGSVKIFYSNLNAR